MAKFSFKCALLQASLAGAFLFTQAPSHAGVWVLYQYWTETTAIQVGDGSVGDGTAYTSKQFFGPKSTDIYDPFPIKVSTQSPSFYNTQVQIISQLRWSRNSDGFGHDDPFDNPPPKVYLLQSAGAGASAWSEDASLATLSASDGMGDRPVTELSVNDGTPYNFINSNGGKIIAIDTYGDETITLPAVDLSASVSLPASQSVPQDTRRLLFASVGSNCKVVVAQISSDIEPSYKKGVSPFQTGPAQEPNVRNDDGSMTVDTVTSWLPGVLKYADGNWSGGFNISASQNAFQSPYYDWTSSWSDVTVLPGMNGILLTENLSAEKGAAFGVGVEFHKPYDAVTLNQPVTFTANVKDEDGKISGSLVNTYTINFHLPYENWDKYKADSQPSWQDVTTTVASPGYATANGSIGLTYDFNPAYLGEVGSVFGTDAFGVIGTFTPPPYSGLFAALSLASATLAPVKSNGIANFVDCWNDPDSKFEPAKGSWPQSRYRMTPKMQVGYISHYMQADNYDFHGYVGPVRKVVAQWDGTQKFTGDFVAPKIGGDGDGPGTIQTFPAPFRLGVQEIFHSSGGSFFSGGGFE